MGRTKGPYNEEFPVGTKVQIANRESLEKFIAEWKLHNPLTVEQLNFANKIAVIKKVGFYHGGDELYTLVAIPGLWHEINLLPITQGNA